MFSVYAVLDATFAGDPDMVLFLILYFKQYQHFLTTLCVIVFVLTNLFTTWKEKHQVLAEKKHKKAKEFMLDIAMQRDWPITIAESHFRKIMGHNPQYSPRC